MLLLRPKPPNSSDEVKPQIVFTPRPGFKRTHNELSRELIYAHRCPVCGNVMQAFFHTSEEIKLWVYEETTLLSQGEKNAGEIRKIYPDEKAKPGESCYRSYFDQFSHSQKLVLKNHILRQRSIQDRQGKYGGEGAWEIGERPCLKTGIFALREELLIRDVLLFGTMPDHEVMNYNIPNLQVLLTPLGAGDPVLFQVVPPVGDALPVVLVDREDVVNGYSYTVRPRLANYLKAIQ
jgi:hypothetical protein